ncbi:MAG TPA: DNA-3-methyladenine glycosylase 2 family protein [Alphaproteobacteria bacterium]|nr:DNA-3-methyladenine glycosylase 2 family protein [Alphaproteobacteria bacterium]
MAASDPSGSDPSGSARLHRRFVETAAGLSRPLKEALDRAGPLGLPDRSQVTPGYFLSRTVVNQLLSAPAARSIWRRVEDLARETGCEIPALFIRERETQVRACGVSAAKFQALLALAGAEREGGLDAASLKAMDDLARAQHLRAIRGIGPWSCDMVALFYCRSPDIWPEGDAAVQRTFKGLIGRRHPARTAARFAPHRSTLALYMWRLVALERSDLAPPGGA